VYAQVGDVFRKLFGSYAGWAHSVLFCADLKSFQHMFAASATSMAPVASVIPNGHTDSNIKAEIRSQDTQAAAGVLAGAPVRVDYGAAVVTSLAMVKVEPGTSYDESMSLVSSTATVPLQQLKKRRAPAAASQRKRKRERSRDDGDVPADTSLRAHVHAPVKAELPVDDEIKVHAVAGHSSAQPPSSSMTTQASSSMHVQVSYATLPVGAAPADVDTDTDHDMQDMLMDRQRADAPSSISGSARVPARQRKRRVKRGGAAAEE